MKAWKEVCTVHVPHSSVYALIVYKLNWDVFCDYLIYLKTCSATLHTT